MMELMTYDKEGWYVVICTLTQILDVNIHIYALAAPTVSRHSATIIQDDMCNFCSCCCDPLGLIKVGVTNEATTGIAVGF